ncbi:MAG: hypothetical protein KAX25_06270, partial [Dehalococcoidia bacterium]|nr:hypothetical protein [Dehalococcoidia bacterium]
DFAQVLINHTGLEATGEALLVSLTGPEMSYTLTDVEGLEYGSYYWRVRAIDGAQNGAEESYWTAPYSFKSGLLPLWAVIAIAVLVAVLIGGLVFVLVRRGTPYD